MERDVKLCMSVTVGGQYFGVTHAAWEVGTGEIVLPPQAYAAVDPGQEEEMLRDLVRWCTETIAALRQGVL